MINMSLRFYRLENKNTSGIGAISYMYLKSNSYIRVIVLCVSHIAHLQHKI